MKVTPRTIYLNENIWEEWDEFVNNDHNKEVYGEGLEDLALEDGYFDMEVYADSREKFGDSWMELGVPNEEYRKTGGFQRWRIKKNTPFMQMGLMMRY